MWQSLAIVTHSNVARHNDPMDCREGYMITLSKTEVRMHVDTCLGNNSASFSTASQLAFFDPAIHHRIQSEGDGLVRSLVLYSPAREVAPELRQLLADIAFPAERQMEDFPNAQLYETVDDSEISTDSDQEETSHSSDQHLDSSSATDATTTTSAPASSATSHLQPALSPTLPWLSQTDDLLAGAADSNNSNNSDDVSKLVQWAKGLASAHTPKQLRVIVASEQRTARRLQDCRCASDRTKAQDIIMAAMKRCGMSPGKPKTEDGREKDSKKTSRKDDRQPPAPPQQPTPPAAQENKPANRGSGDSAKDKDKASPPRQPRRDDKKQKPTKEPATTSKFELIASDWPATMPPQPEWSADTAGVFLTESADTVARWGQQCKFSKLPVLAVSPARPNLQDYPISKRVIRFKETCEGKPPRIVHLNAFVTQLTYAPIPAFESKPEIAIQCTRSTIVVRGRVLERELDPELLKRLTSKRKGAAVEALAELLPTKAKAHLLDVWAFQPNGEAGYTFCCRITLEKTEAFLALSGAGCIWTDTPSGLPEREELRVTWLKTRDPTTGLPTPLDRKSIDSLLRRHPGHLGLIRGKEDELAVRGRADVTQSIRDELGQQSAKLYRLVNVPVHLETQDVEEIISQMNWPASLMPHSKTCRKHAATWNIRADVPPPAEIFPLTA
eukprot:1940755-Amphidinium_carterae.1